MRNFRSSKPAVVSGAVVSLRGYCLHGSPSADPHADPLLEAVPRRPVVCWFCWFESSKTTVLSGMLEK